jgi:hypothetical protein
LIINDISTGKYIANEGLGIEYCPCCRHLNHLGKITRFMSYDQKLCMR